MSDSCHRLVCARNFRNAHGRRHCPQRPEREPRPVASGAPARAPPQPGGARARAWTLARDDHRRPARPRARGHGRAAGRRARRRAPPHNRPPAAAGLAGAHAAYAVGLDFGHRHVRAAVCDLGGQIISDQWAAFDVDDHRWRASTWPRTSPRGARGGRGRARARDRRRRGLPAPVDAATGRVHADGILPGWDGIQPARELETRLGLPVQLENDANAGAMGEHLFGAGRGVADMLYLRLSAGSRAGADPRRRAVWRRSGIAGELGHIPWSTTG